ncbi:MAG TPA: hypothetical protein VOB72_24105 [Candidatus Dormibacteraeota bacterium]|nr:hypothetical protein [Candidatus Dormibacteraeota bacterium]
MESSVAGDLFRSLEPCHGIVYVAAERGAVYARLGLEPGAMYYFATRAAALGPASAELVRATFYDFFSPRVVRAVIPEAWRRAAPERIVGARLAVADAALRRVLGAGVDGPELAEAAELAREAASACPPAGRPLYAAHAALPWPQEPHLVLWHAQTLLREFRGDGHVASLLGAGIGGLEAHITYEATGAMPAGVLQATRGWSDAEWEAGRARLRGRGWLDAAGRLTDAGREARAALERRTDELAMAPWRHLGPAACARLRALARPLSEALVASGDFPVAPSYWDGPPPRRSRAAGGGAHAV